jgi:hypothetical protein
MKNHLTLLLTACLFATTPLLAHGPGHSHGSRETRAEVNEALGLGGGRTGSHEHHDHHGEEDVSSSGKSLKAPVSVEESERWWGASLETGWESRHVHYGVDETGDFGAYTTELSVWIGDFSLGAWSGFGTGNSFEEWDFTAAYNFELGPVFFIPGYNFRYSPGVVEEGHAHGEEEHGDHEEEHGEEDHGGGGA